MLDEMSRELQERDEPAISEGFGLRLIYCKEDRGVLSGSRKGSIRKLQGFCTFVLTGFTA